MKRMKKKQIKNKKKKNSSVQLIVALLLVLAMVLFFIKPNFQNKPQEWSKTDTEIEFKKEGELSFFDKVDKQLITSIDIEIADNDYERMVGLMYRYSMSDRVGMFFIMEDEVPQSFWMKDTYISLDIIYLNKDLKIVKLQKNTQPLSEESIPSIEKSKYVLEVIGGFCDKLNIEEGDSAKYEKVVVTNKN
jgi:uncharacterized membrane protein (UPF0127 family)